MSEKPGKTESSQEWLESKIQSRNGRHRTRAQNHLAFFQTNPTYDEYLARVEEARVKGTKSTYCSEKSIIKDGDFINSIIGRVWASQRIKAERKSERERYLTGLTDCLPDAFFEEVEEVVPIMEEFLKTVPVNQENFPRFTKTSCLFAQRVLDLMAKEDEIHRSLSEDALGKIREAEEEFERKYSH